MIKTYSETISEINVEKMGWERSIYLTFDIDWASDFVIADTLELLSRFNLSATFFITHDTPLLKEIRANPRYELGIHPNFNDLIFRDGNQDIKTVREKMDELKQIVPEALSVRSHSTTNSSKLLEIFQEYDIQFDCNYIIPYHVTDKIAPWRLWNDMTRIPYYYSDDLSLAYNLVDESMPQISEREGLKVFDFHPVHIYLNTDSIATYEKTRDIHRNEKLFLQNRVAKRGTRDKFLELIKIVASREL